ncbi:MAG: bacteriohemerythrin [Rhodospirillales bacterium]|nr:bacteriohemerythrin [Rhodospirillales bacterium]
MKRIILTVVFLLFFAIPAHAGFDDGMDAYRLGNFDKALDVWLPMAHSGDARAQYGIGVMYQKGKGVRKNQAKAAEWLRKAAEADNPAAQNNLGVSYRRGLGVEVDFNEALKWFRRAAEQGHPRAEYNLAIMYSEGQGTPKDDAKAYVWLEFAVKDLPIKGRKSTRALRAKIAKRLPPDDLKRAKRMAEEWDAKRTEWGKSVTLIPWKDSYRVGKTDLDDQHRRLFGLINRLYRAWIYGDEINVLGEVFDNLLSYTVYHFKHEEDLLFKKSGAHFRSQKELHAHLQEQVLAFRDRYLKGSEASQLTSEMSEFLRNWMTVHVLDADMQYKRVFR